ncbi:MAG: GMC family oxidoreductase, partial [Rhodoferax sp.]|nr:GMC family oxidoreductase [Rhodoferax sp.]
AGAVLPLAMRYFRDRRSFKPQDAEVALAFNCEQLPCARSHIDLSDQVDALGMRRLRVDWQIDGSELRAMRALGQRVKRQFEKQGLAEISLDPRLMDGDPSFLASVHDAIHHMGTTRMSTDPAHGFVDPNLKVHGTGNLYVAGAAVFPSTGFANPTFTAIALALRLAVHLKAEIGRA